MNQSTCIKTDRTSTKSANTKLALLTTKETLACGVAFVVFFIECCRYVYLIRLPDSRLVQFIPDDAFYYMVLGKNFSSLHLWTFDGTARATGFHLLWGYTNALIYWLFPKITFHQIFTLLYFVSTTLIVMGVALTSITVVRRMGRFALVGPLLIFCMTWTIQQANFLMESSLVIFFTSLAFYLIFGDERPLTRRNIPWIAAAGMFGMMARSDFGVLAFTLFGGLMIIRSIARKRAAILFSGAIIGLCILVAHTYITSGHLVQGSAAEKRHWSQLRGDKLSPTIKFSLAPLLAEPYPLVGSVSLNSASRLIFIFSFALFAAWIQKRKDPLTISMIAVGGGCG